ncbi:hypothetical protein HKX48_009328 [Thoreauomyces humboldtii]|nr:hypothetical protein HKX48_009328 [Thoreauomyces humboldtii]
MSSLRRRTGSLVGAPGASLLDKFKDFDAYAKPIEDFRIKTASGAAVTLASMVVIFVLLLSEFIDWRTVTLQPSLEVDKKRNEKMTINLNITTPRVPCYLLSIDVMDVAGDHQNDIHSSIFKVRLDEHGKAIETKKSEIGETTHEDDKVAERLKDPKYCGSCYNGQAPPSGCCNTCEDVQKAYADKGWSFANAGEVEQCVKEGWAEKVAQQSHEGCNVWGKLQVNKVAGNFHLAPGKSFSQANMHVHDLAPYLAAKKFDFTHVIHSLSFGKRVDTFANPLDAVDKSTHEGSKTSGNEHCISKADNLTLPPIAAYYMFQYYLKVVSTKFRFLNSTSVHTNQYSVTEHERDTNPMKGQGGLPGNARNHHQRSE